MPGTTKSLAYRISNPVEAGEADGLAADDFEAEVDVEEEGVGVDDVADFSFVEVAWVAGAGGVCRFGRR